MEKPEKVIACYHLDDLVHYENDGNIQRKLEQLRVGEYTVKVTEQTAFETSVDHLNNHLPTCDLVIAKLGERAVQYPFVNWAHKNRFDKDEQHRAVIAVIPSEKEVHKDLPQAIREHAISEEPKESFEERLFQKVTELLQSTGQKPLHPMGNISAGLAINYYIGALKMLLSTDFKIKFGEITGDESSAVPMVILIPKECTISYEYLQEHLGSKTVVEFKTLFNGNNRTFSGSKYTIQGEKGKRDISVDVPNIITTLDKMTRKMPGMDPLTKDAIYMYREEFVRELRILLQKEHKHECVFVEFDESDNLKQKILTGLKEFDSPQEKDNERPTAVLFKPEESPQTRTKFYNAFEASLAKNVNVLSVEFVGKAKDPNFNINFRKSENKPTVFVFIENGELPQEHLDYIIEIIEAQSPDQRLQLIPVYLDCDEVKCASKTHYEHINSLRFSSNDVDAEGKLSGNGKNEMLRAVNAATGTNPLNYPIGPVFAGLAWTVCLNYLKPFLPDKVEGLKMAQKEYNKEDKDEIIKFPKQILLGEASYKTIGDFSELTGFENIKENHTVRTAAGTERTYTTTMYRVTYNGKKYLVGIEFVRPLACIGEIEQTLQVGLSTHDKKVQFEEFGTLFTRLIKTYNLECAYCAYDESDEEKCGKVDGQVNLAKVIAEFVECQLLSQGIENMDIN